MLIGTGNRTYAVLVTDRRYTENGRLRDAADDDRNKIILLRAGSLKLAVGFTGLARAGAFHTDEFLADALHDAISRDGQVVLHIDQVAGRMSHAFDRLRCSDTDKLCWILMVGFHEHMETGVILPTYTFMSNACRNQDGRLRPGPFQWQVFEPPDDRQDAAYAMTSHRDVLRNGEAERLTQLASRQIPPYGIVDLSVELVRRASQEPAARGTIGQQCSSAIVWADRNKNSEMDYHPTVAVRGIPTPLLVSPRGVTSLRIDGVDAPARLPMRHKRAPCPCGSGRRYGDCHMRRRNRTRATLAT